MKAAKDKDNLSPRERAAVTHHLKGLTITQAYIKAGYNAKGAAANTNASRLFSKPHIKAAIAAQQAANQQSTDVELSEIIGFLAKVMRTPIGEIDESSPLIQSYTRTEGELATTIKYQMVPKMDAVKHLSFLLGFDPAKKHEVTPDNDLKSLLLTIRSND